MLPPETRYAKSGSVHIAYQVSGHGPLDLVVVNAFGSHLEYAWEEPTFARYLQRLASFSRLMRFDKRGTGLSDRVAEANLPTLEQLMDDVRAVMDAVGSQRAALYGMSEGGSMSILFAATYPERTRALVLYGAFARRVWAPDYPWAPTLPERQRHFERVEQSWGRELDVSTSIPGRAQDSVFLRWLLTYQRLSMSPGSAAALLRMNSEIDVRHVLPAIRVPTLVLRRVGDLDVQVENGRYLAAHIVGAKYVELPGIDHNLIGSDTDAIVDRIENSLSLYRARVAS
jgi:pimeloyl-ACP methyl ester carboxylesterase